MEAWCKMIFDFPVQLVDFGVAAVNFLGRRVGNRNGNSTCNKE